MLLKEHVAVVTGEARGIGKGIVDKLSEEGCTVVIADIAEDAAASTAAGVRAKGGEALFIRCDITNSRPLQRVGTPQELGNAVLFYQAGSRTSHGRMHLSSGGSPVEVHGRNRIGAFTTG
ncbi:MAG: 4-formylbenzenesulfonate dehydrogenase TsaC1/TsaC2 [Syntrophorhabdus sp. PtaU1.Bin153]|nr:MAG: 4-formylbenzenesulfonate dehydrogenase TsaC1/TsaC2 [Syntrophorhabdus sp. PtaU1.Bin153]